MPIFTSRFDLSRYGGGRFDVSAGTAPPPLDQDPVTHILATWFPAEAHDGSVFPVALHYDTDGGLYTSDYDFADHRGTGASYYVSTTGSDSNEGSQAAPFRTFAAAEAAASAGDVIHVAAGRYPPLRVLKDGLTILAPGAMFGDLLAEADITWGPLVAGRQTATLASGLLDGFVDLAVLDGGFAQVAQVVADTTEADAFQGMGKAVILEGAPTVLGASNGRDLSGLGDSDIAAWSVTAVAPLVVAQTVSVTIQGAAFVGGSAFAMDLNHSGLVVLDTCHFLGGRGQLIELNSTAGGRTLLSGGCYRGSRRDDVIDYRGSHIGVELGILCDQAGTATNDNASTAHDEAKVMRVGGTYRDGARTIHDINSSAIYMADCTIDSGDSHGEDICLRCGSVGYYAALVLEGTASFDNMGTASFYDQEIDGYTFTGTPASFTYVNIPAPPPPATNVHLNLRMDTALLYQDAGQTLPAVADGDMVQSIVSGGVTLNADTANLVLRASGSQRYLEFDGTTKLSVLGFGAATGTDLMALAVVRTGIPGANGTILLGAASGDYLFRMSLSGDADRDAGLGVEHYVDGGVAVTAANVLQPAAQDGTDHVISAYPLDLSAGDWTSPIVGGFSNGNFNLVGRLYALVIADYDTATEYALRQELGGLAGL